MSEKVVLPKFEIPSERGHPAVAMAKIMGGVLLVSMLLLGGATYRRHAAQLQAEQQRDALIAARIAEANAAVEAAKARAAEAAAKEAAVKAKIESDKLAAKQAKDKATADAKLALAEEHHKGGHHHGAKASSKASNKGSKAVASKSAADDKKSSAPKSTRDNAAIDKMLASFK